MDDKGHLQNVDSGEHFGSTTCFTRRCVEVQVLRCSSNVPRYTSVYLSGVIFVDDDVDDHKHLHKIINDNSCIWVAENWRESHLSRLSSTSFGLWYLVTVGSPTGTNKTTSS